MTNSPHQYVVFGALLLATAGQIGVVAAAPSGPGAQIEGTDPLVIDSRTSSAFGSDAGAVERAGDSLERAFAEVVQALDLPGMIVLVGTASRLDDLTDNAVRSTIYEAVAERTAIHQTTLAEEADVSPSTVRYHARLLENAGIVSVDTVWGKRCLSLATTDRTDVLLTAALDDPALRQVLTTLLEREPVSVSELADELDRAPSTVCHHLQRLSEADLVERERDGSAVYTSLSERVREYIHGEL